MTSTSLLITNDESLSVHDCRISGITPGGTDSIITSLFPLSSLNTVMYREYRRTVWFSNIVSEYNSDSSCFLKFSIRGKYCIFGYVYICDYCRCGCTTASALMVYPPSTIRVNEYVPFSSVVSIRLEGRGPSLMISKDSGIS